MGIIVYTVQDLRGSEALRMSNNKMDYWDYSEEMSDKTTKEEQSGQVRLLLLLSTVDVNFWLTKDLSLLKFDFSILWNWYLLRV